MTDVSTAAVERLCASMQSGNFHRLEALRALTALAADRDRWQARAEALEAERNELWDDLQCFLPLWAVRHAEINGLPEGHLHPQHYDRMKAIGCRMDAFARAALGGAA